MAIIYRDYENEEHRISLRVFTRVQCDLVTFYSFFSWIENLYEEIGVKDHPISR